MLQDCETQTASLNPLVSKHRVRLTVFVVLVVLAFCLRIFLSLFLLVIVMIFLTGYSFYNFNLKDKQNRS